MRTLQIVWAVCSIAVMLVSTAQAEVPEYAWDDYSEEKLQQHLKDGDVVLLHVIHRAQVASARSLYEVLEKPAIRAVVYVNEIVTLRASGNDIALATRIAGRPARTPLVILWTGDKDGKRILLEEKDISVANVLKALRDIQHHRKQQQGSDSTDAP